MIRLADGLIKLISMSEKFWRRMWRAGAGYGLIGWLGIASPLIGAAVPPAEKLLPPETLFVLSAPDWTRLMATLRQAPQARLWNDPAMKPFRTRLESKWTEEVVRPLERDLGIRFADYRALLQGQLTLAILPEDWLTKAGGDGAPGLVLLLDVRDQGELLAKNLATLRQRLAAAGKPIRTEKIRDVEFAVVHLTTNDIPATVRRLLPQKQEVHELGANPAGKPSATQLVLGQQGSLLILSTTTAAAEKVVARLSGAGSPTLAESAEFEAGRQALFRESPLFGWLNAKQLLELAVQSFGAGQNTAAPSPIPRPNLDKLMTITGLGGLKSLAFDYRDAGAGPLLGLFLNAPEATRNGLLKLLAVEAKDAAPPAFIPADVLKFARYRIAGQQVIATLEAALNELSPGTFNFLLKNANEAVRLDEPDYDLRKNIFENLGDDVITFQKPPQGKALADLEAAPTVVLIASPNADKLAASLKGLFIVALPQGGSPQVREYLGRKIYTVKLSGVVGGDAANALHYVANGGYVAFSSQAAALEDYLRSTDNQGLALRATAGFAAATEAVGGMGTGWLSYEDQRGTMRLTIDALTHAVAATNRSEFDAVFASLIPFAPPEAELKEWVDLSLLPDFNQIAKYYGFTVATGQASASGITFRYFVPTPAELRPPTSP